jgi:DNA end-binding protein Ku
MTERNVNARAAWKGTVSLGLMSFPVKLYVTADREVSPLHQICTEHTARINERKWCLPGEHEVSADELGKGFQVGDGVVRITTEQLAALPKVQAKMVQLESFLYSEWVPSVYRRQAYYMVPEKGSEHQLGILAEGLGTTKRAGFGRIAISDRWRMCLVELVPVGAKMRMVLTTLYWEAEIRDPDPLPSPFPYSNSVEESLMAVKLVKSMAGKFEPEKYHDAYGEALESLLDEAASGQIPVQGLKPSEPIPDLMGALKASIAQAKKDRAREKSVQEKAS